MVSTTWSLFNPRTTTVYLQVANDFFQSNVTVWDEVISRRLMEEWLHRSQAGSSRTGAVVGSIDKSHSLISCVEFMLEQLNTTQLVALRCTRVPSSLMATKRRNLIRTFCRVFLQQDWKISHSSYKLVCVLCMFSKVIRKSLQRKNKYGIWVSKYI